MRLLFAGTSDIGIPALKALRAEHQLVGLLTQPDRAVGRHQLLTAPATKGFLQEHSPSTPFFQPEQLHDPAFLEKLRALRPEVMVTMSYGKILPSNLLKIPSLACLNIHTSLLPRHRGATPIQASILAGDEETGVTIMYMAEGIDTGDILLQKKISLTPQETTGSLTQRLAKLAPKAILEALELLQEGRATRLPQPAEGISITRHINRSTATLDPAQGAIPLERLIRAMNPKPGAHGIFSLPSGKSISLKIFSATVASEIVDKTLASLFLSQDQKLLLACHQGALWLHEVQPEGRARMSAAAFVAGYFRTLF